MYPNALKQLVLEAIDELKGQDVQCLDVRPLTELFDCMIVVSGNSSRHVRALVERIIERCVAAGREPLGVEGRDPGDWVLIDLVELVVHIMLPATRELYDIESLWRAEDFAGTAPSAGSGQLAS